MLILEVAMASHSASRQERKGQLALCGGGAKVQLHNIDHGDGEAVMKMYVPAGYREVSGHHQVALLISFSPVEVMGEYSGLWLGYLSMGLHVSPHRLPGTTIYRASCLEPMVDELPMACCSWMDARRWP